MPEHDLIDIGRRNAGVRQCLVRYPDDETLDGFGIEFAKRRMRPSDDAGCHGRSPQNSANRSVDELTTKFVLNVNPDNVVEGAFFGGETKLARPLGLKIPGPAVNDVHNERVRLALDPR